MRKLGLVLALPSFLVEMKKNTLLLVALLGLSFLLIESIRPIKAGASAGDLTWRRLSQEQTDVSAPVTVKAAGRGNPWISLGDGRDVLTSYAGADELEQILGQYLALPLALASGDFDENGVPDLVSGYLGPGGGILALHRGSVDSIYSKT